MKLVIKFRSGRTLWNEMRTGAYGWIYLLHTTGKSGQHRRLTQCYYNHSDNAFYPVGVSREQVPIGRVFGWAPYPKATDVRSR